MIRQLRLFALSGVLSGDAGSTPSVENDDARTGKSAPAVK